MQRMLDALECARAAAWGSCRPGAHLLASARPRSSELKVVSPTEPLWCSADSAGCSSRMGLAGSPEAVRLTQAALLSMLRKASCASACAARQPASAPARGSAALCRLCLLRCLPALARAAGFAVMRAVGCWRCTGASRGLRHTGMPSMQALQRQQGCSVPGRRRLASLPRTQSRLRWQPQRGTPSQRQGSG